MFGCCGVEVVAVFEEVEGLGQVLAGEVGVGVVAIGASLDGGRLSGEVVLLGLERVWGDGAAQVSVAAGRLRGVPSWSW